MKKPFAHYLTVGKADIDRNTSIEIVWNTAPDTFTLVVFRIRPAPCKPALLTEELGPFTSIGQLRKHLQHLFADAIEQHLYQNGISSLSIPSRKRASPVSIIA